MTTLEVYIEKKSKCEYQIVASDGTPLGGVIDGFANILSFKNEFSAKSYIELDKRLVLKGTRLWKRVK